MLFGRPLAGGCYVAQRLHSPLVILFRCLFLCCLPVSEYLITEECGLVGVACAKWLSLAVS